MIGFSNIKTIAGCVEAQAMADFVERVITFNCGSAFFSNATRPKERQAAKIRELQGLLRAEGLCSVSSQASVLGLSRSTTWALLKANHKQSGVSASVLKRMLGTPDLPQCVRQWIEEYVHERLAGAYGHNPARLRLFRKQFVQSARWTDRDTIGGAA